MTGYSRPLARLASLPLGDLVGTYRVTFPNRPLPVRAGTGELSRDLLIAALLPPIHRGRRVTRPYPEEAL